MKETWAQLLVGGGGLFTLIRYLFKQQAESQNKFLSHLAAKEKLDKEYIEQKNGHMERIADKFNTTVLDFGKKLEDLTIAVATKKR